jgi:hypothetical protein
LCRIYGQHVRQHPNEFPVVELGADAYQHQNKQYGRVKVPEFTVVDWENKSVFDDAPEADDDDARIPLPDFTKPIAGNGGQSAGPLEMPELPASLNRRGEATAEAEQPIKRGRGRPPKNPPTTRF